MTLRETMLAILIPLLGVIAYLGLGAYLSDRDLVDRLLRQQTALQEAGVINDLVHELQKERGYSAGFISSQGANFSDALPAQHASTDTALQNFETRLELASRTAAEDLAKARSALALLTEWRTAILAKEKTVPELAGFYTGLVNSLLDASNNVQAAFATDGLGSRIEGRALIGLAKESAGLERAMGATGLGRGTFDMALHTRFVSLGAAQTAMLADSARTMQRPELLESLYVDPAATTLREMRQQIIGSVHPGGSLEGLTAPAWFTASTQWIDLLRDTELALSDELIVTAREQADETAMASMRRLGLAAAIALAATILSVLLFEGMLRRIKGMIRLMAEYRDGHFEKEVPAYATRTELGHMAQVLDAFKEAICAAQKESARAKEEDEARLNAAHQQVVDMLSEGLHALAKADLTIRFQTPLAPKYDHIRNDFNTAADRLDDVISGLAKAVTYIAERARGLDAATESLAERTSQQGSAVENSAEGLGRVTAETKADVQKINGAKDEAAKASQTAAESDVTVARAIAAMDQISQRSDEISNIVNAIEELAFQTNLLALNARVEAARAGESGRGFAVVAEEVRDLAGRSSKSAMEIKALIRESHREVQDGVQLVNGAGQSLQSMVSVVQAMDATLTEISRSAKAHADDLSSVDTAMSLMRELTEANTAMVSDSRAISTDMTRAAEGLARIVADFRLVRDKPGSGADRANMAA
jgi:methyl-accepting chemotaxis protein